MSFKLFLFFSVSLLNLTWAGQNRAWACEAGTIPNLGRYKSSFSTESVDKKWFFKYLFENQIWEEIPAADAHELHEDGHHLHVKTQEYFHHFTLGTRATEKLTISGEIPYVIRDSIEIESHARLGTDERSQGIGDLHLFGDYAFLKNEKNSAHLVSGVKLPVGQTDELNSGHEKFEAELQPGSGAFDYILGGILQQRFNRSQLNGNLAYVYKTEGTQDYRFGDVLSASFFADYQLNPDSESFITQVGINGNFQYEQKHENAGSEIADSGGTTILLGPTFSIKKDSQVAFTGSVLFPLHQDLGGVHQELDLTWTLGGQLQF
jgi:hypothetical protein